MLNRLFIRMRGLVRREEVEAEFDEEIRYHFEREVERRISLGTDPETARRETRLEFGNPLAVKDEARMTWRWTWLDDLIHDLRLAMRTLRRSPRFAIAGAATLGVGMGGVMGIFVLVDAVLLRPLPYPDPDRLVTITHSAPGLGLTDAGHSFGNYHHYRDNSDALQDFTIYNENVVELSGGGEPERVRVAIVTPSFFTTLGVPAGKGRLFSHEEGLPGTRSDIVIISHDLWARRYGSNPDIIGRTVELNRVPREVIGVMPPGFGFPRPETDVWYPRDFQMVGVQLNQLYLSGIARLNPDATPEFAERELNTLIPGLAEPSQMTLTELQETGLTAHVQTLHAATLGELSAVLWLVFASMVLVLSIAGANVASLFLVRAQERHAEMTVRSALGAGRAERLRIFLVEGLVLGAVAAAVAVPLAIWLVEGVRVFGPADLPRLHEVAFGTEHIMITLGGSLLLGAFLSIMPLLKSARSVALRVDGRTAVGPAQRRAMQALTVAQIAVGFALVVGATLLLQSFWRLRNVDPGFDPENVLTMAIALPARSYDGEAAEVRFWRELSERTRAIPGVISVGAVGALPLSPGDFVDDFLREPLSIENVPDPTEGAPVVSFISVTAEYFETVRIQTLAGAIPAGWASATPTVVVNAAFVRRFLDGRDPLTTRVRPNRTWTTVPWHEVRAVVSDIRDDGLISDPTPVVYVLATEVQDEEAFWPSHMNLAIKTAVPPLSLAGAVRNAVWDIDPLLPVARIRTMEDIVNQATAPERFTTLALSLSAAIALFLAAVSTYGLVAYAVSRRTKELGVRIALGSSAGGIRRLVLQQGLMLAVGGVTMGIFLALAGGRIIQSLLYGIQAADVATLAAATVVLALVVMVAVDVPARRAARLDPVDALRRE